MGKRKEVIISGEPTQSNPKKSVKVKEEKANTESDFQKNSTKLSLKPHVKKRGKKYRKVAELIEKNKLYSVEEALQLVKQIAYSKFNETVELHLKLGVDPKKTDETVRGVAFLPWGTGKNIRVGAVVTPGREKEAKEAGADVVGSQDLIEQIKKGKIDFDVLVATPDMMSKLAEIAKILGPKGLMPNPKMGTVSNEIKKMIEEIKKGKVEFKMDKEGNLHLILGKVSFETQQLKENLEALMEAVFAAKPEKLKGEYIKSATITTTMGPAIRINPIFLARK